MIETRNLRHLPGSLEAALHLLLRLSLGLGRVRIGYFQFHWLCASSTCM